MSVDDENQDRSPLVPVGAGRQDQGAIQAPISGRQVRLRLTLGQETLEILGPGGTTELTIILTDRGPKLVIDAADIQINTVNRIAVACESFELNAREGIALSGAEAALVARTGDLSLKANDNVKVVGEQIRLNCDKPDKVPIWMERELSARLARGEPGAPETAEDGGRNKP